MRRASVTENVFATEVGIMADIRVCFTKMDRLKYISHLDLQRAVARMLVRSGLPIGYSEGFNPHPKLNIALPLSIYQEGERELFDFRVADGTPIDEITEKLKKSAFDGMEIVSVEPAVGKLRTKQATWRLEMETDVTPEEFENALSGEMIVTKRSKTGEKSVDISPMCRFVSAEREENVLVARVILNAAGNDYLNPSYVASFFGDRVKLLRTVRENILF